MKTKWHGGVNSLLCTDLSVFFFTLFGLWPALYIIRHFLCLVAGCKGIIINPHKLPGSAIIFFSVLRAHDSEKKDMQKGSSHSPSFFLKGPNFILDHGSLPPRGRH